MPLYRHDGKLLRATGGGLAGDEACCCGECLKLYSSVAQCCFSLSARVQNYHVEGPLSQFSKVVATQNGQSSGPELIGTGADQVLRFLIPVTATYRELDGTFINTSNDTFGTVALATPQNSLYWGNNSAPNAVATQDDCAGHHSTGSITLDDPNGDSYTVPTQLDLEIVGNTCCRSSVNNECVSNSVGDADGLCNPLP